MSLFGTSPGSAALFDDSRPPPGVSLFDGDDNDPSGSSHWDISPSPRRSRSRADVIRSLVSADDLPAPYTQAFDAALRDDPVSGPGGERAGPGAVAAVFAAARVPTDQQAHIMNVMAATATNGDGDGVALDRAEFAVLLALVGLAQEGEPVSLDGVDERRESLPVPKLAGLTAEPVLVPVAEPDPYQESGYQNNSPYESQSQSSQYNAQHESVNPQHNSSSQYSAPQNESIDPQHSSPQYSQHSSQQYSQQQPTCASRVLSRPPAMDYPDAESHPWGEPSFNDTKNDAPIESDVGNSLSQPYDPSPREDDQPFEAPLPASPSPISDHHHSGSSSSFTMPSHPPSVSPPRQAPAPGWSYFGGRPAGFGESPLNNNSMQPAQVASPFGSPPVYNPTPPPRAHSSSLVNSSSSIVNSSLAAATTASNAPRPEEHVTVALMPEKEGMFLFQHHNYEVSSPRRNNSKVIRRYSDFVWLLDCLHKRYPFRILPLLPPKRVAVNGNHLSNDGAFIEKRRRGLGRFLNAIVRHPVLSQEQLVVMFLTVPTELAVWRKQATISVQDEFTGRALPPGLQDSLPNELEELFDRTRAAVKRSADLYITVCNTVDRLVKRADGVAADHGRLALSLASLVDVTAETYVSSADTSDVPRINAGLVATGQHIRQAQSLMEDESRAWEVGVLEDLKRQRDTLVSVRDLFDRRDRLDRDDIPALERRIESNEAKLQSLRAKAGSGAAVKPGEVERVVEAIVRDKDAIVQQHNRSVFVRECVRDELVHFHSSLYHVTRWNQDWAQERVKYTEMLADNWRRLLGDLDRMPVLG